MKSKKSCYNLFSIPKAKPGYLPIKIRQLFLWTDPYLPDLMSILKNTAVCCIFVHICVQDILYQRHSNPEYDDNSFCYLHEYKLVLHQFCSKIRSSNPHRRRSTENLKMKEKKCKYSWQSPLGIWAPNV